MTSRKISSDSIILLLFLLCWIVYFTSYLGRLNYSAAMTSLLNTGIIDKIQAGMISTLFFLCYASGQLVNGFLCNKLGFKSMMILGMFGTALANFLMGFCTEFHPMAVLWAVNGYAQSMIWPSIVSMFTNFFPKEVMVKCFTNLASTIAVGTLSSYFLSAMLLKYLSWQWAFIIPAIIITISVLSFILLFPRIQQHIEKDGILETEIGSVIENKKMSFKKIFLTPTMLFLLFPVLVHGVLKDGLTAWIPTYISECFDAGTVTSVLVSMVLPVVNITGAYMARYLREKVQDEVKASAIFFATACLCLTGIWLFGSENLIVSLLLLSISSSSMLAVNIIYISYIPIRYAKYGLSSSVSGFFNATAYLGASLSSTGIGVLAGVSGWGSVMLGFVILTILALLLCCLNFSKETKLKT